MQRKTLLIDTVAQGALLRHFDISVNGHPFRVAHWLRIVTRHYAHSSPTPMHSTRMGTGRRPMMTVYNLSLYTITNLRYARRRQVFAINEKPMGGGNQPPYTPPPPCSVRVKFLVYIGIFRVCVKHLIHWLVLVQNIECTGLNWSGHWPEDGCIWAVPVPEHNQHRVAGLWGHVARQLRPLPGQTHHWRQRRSCEHNKIQHLLNSQASRRIKQICY